MRWGDAEPRLGAVMLVCVWGGGGGSQGQTEAKRLEGRSHACSIGSCIAAHAPRPARPTLMQVKEGPAV